MCNLTVDAIFSSLRDFKNHSMALNDREITVLAKFLITPVQWNNMNGMNSCSVILTNMCGSVANVECPLGHILLIQVRPYGQHYGFFVDIVQHCNLCSKYVHFKMLARHLS